MAGAVKHMKRSHRSYHAAKPFADFERKALAEKSSKENKSLFEKFMSQFHRTTNK